MNAWALCLLLGILVLTIGVEGSKFKTNYPDYKSYQFQEGQSKAHRYVEEQKSEHTHDTHEPVRETTNPKHAEQPDHSSHGTSHVPQQPQPLPSQVGYLEYIGIILFGALLAFIQIRKLNKTHAQKKSRHKEKEITATENAIETSEKEVRGVKSETEQIVEEARDVEQVVGEESEIDKKVEEDKSMEEEGNEGQVKGVKFAQERKNEREHDSDNEGAACEEEKVDTKETSDKEVSVAEEKKADSDEEWIVVKRETTTSNSSDTEIVERGTEIVEQDMQVEQYRGRSGDPMPDLTTMMEILHISPPSPATPVRERLKMLEIIQKERKLRLKQEHFKKNLHMQRRSLELQQKREERNRERELERQNSVKEEIYQQQIRDDEYHKMIILHLSVGIMLAIWLKVMDFSLFTLPFLSLPSSSSSSSSSFLSSYLPTSFSAIYNLASWINTTRLLYGLFLLVIFIFLWVFVSSLAPYVVLLFAFMHAWESFFRAGIYFFLLWAGASASFYLSRKLGFVRKYKMLKLAILYSINLMAAGLVGGVVAHGDPLNPYRMKFFTDSFAEQLFAYLY